MPSLNTKSNLQSNNSERINFGSIDKITQEINEDKLSISDQEIPFELESKPAYSVEMHKLISKKKQLIDQIHLLQSKQKQIKAKSYNNDKPNKNLRSQITEEEKIKIKHIIAISQEKDKQTAAKLKAIEEEWENNKIATQQMQHQKLKKLAEKHRQEAESKLKKMQQRKLEREKMMREDKKRYEQVKNHKILYEKLLQKWRVSKRQQQQQLQQFKIKKRLQQKFNLQQINQHDKRYSQIINNNKGIRRTKSIQFNRCNQFRSKQMAKKNSKFLETLVEEQLESKRKAIEKEEEQRILQIKKKNYSQSVRLNFKPQKHKKNLFQDCNKHIKYRSRSLSSLQIYNIGNNYMKEIHTNITNQPSQVNTTIHDSMDNSQSVGIKSNKLSKNRDSMDTKYPNYLEKLKEKRISQNPQSQIDQIEKIARDRDRDKLKRATIVANKIGDTNHHKLVSSITAKIKILQHFL